MKAVMTASVRFDARVEVELDDVQLVSVSSMVSELEKHFRAGMLLEANNRVQMDDIHVSYVRGVL